MERITIAGLFNEFSSASETVDELIEQGFTRNQISFVSPTGPKQRGVRPATRGSAFETLNVREVGRAIAAGPLAQEIGAGGDVAKWLEQAGISKKKSKQCLNAVRSGQTLLVLQVPEDQAEQAVARIRGRQVPGPEPQGGHTVGGGIGESPAMIMSSKSGVTRNVRRRGSRHPDEELSGSHGSGSGINE